MTLQKTDTTPEGVTQRSVGPGPGVSMPLIRERLGSEPSRGATAPLWAKPSSPASEGAPLKRAAVAAILRDGDRGPEVLLIRRAEHPQDPWSGHMAFPGGREAPQDADLLATASRETREEMGLDLHKHARLLGALEMLPAIARGRRVGLTIAPFVFELTEDAEIVPNHEVAEWLWTPLGPLLDGSLATTMPYEFEGQRLSLPAHDVEGRLVWGLTHRMLETLFTKLR